jgi:hypothetical protein
MQWNRTEIGLALWFLTAACACAAECGNSPANELNIDVGSTRILVSPDQKWRFTSVGPSSRDRNAALYIQNLGTSQEWNEGSIERHGTVFWSEDSKRLFLRDEYAADDTKIRVFDVTGAAPKEVRDLDRSIQRAIFARIPANETTLWLYYPRVCFAANDSSTIIVVADAPLVLKKENSKGKDFSLKLTVNLASLRIEVSGPDAPRFQ